MPKRSAGAISWSVGETRGSLICLLSVLLACGEGPGLEDTGADTSISDSGPDVAPIVTDLAPPATAVLPNEEPCPAGWQSVDVGPARGCTPWLPDAVDCTFPEVRFPGDPACARLGPACPGPTAWPADLPTDGSVIYVREGASGGDGSEAAPLATLAEAVSGIAPGATIALSEGSYAGDVFIPDGVTLRGACVAGTEVVGSFGDATTSTIALGRDTTLADLRVRGDRPGVRETNGGLATLRNVWISGAAIGLGVNLPGSRVEGSGIVLDGVEFFGDAGFGLFVGNGAQAMVTRFAARDVQGTSVIVGTAGSTLSLSDAAILNSISPEDRAQGIGIASVNDAELELSRALIDGANSSGLFVQNRASARISDLTIRNVATDGTRGFGAFGMGVQSDGTAEIERVYVSQTEASGFVVIGFRTALVGSDVIIDDIRGTTVEGLTGTGVLVDSASVRFDRTFIRNARNAGVTVTRPEGSGTFTDLTVHSIAPEVAANGAGIGLDVTFGGVAFVTRGAFEENTAAGVLVTGPTSVATLQDITIGRTVPDGEGRYGRGLSAQGGAMLTADRVAIADNVEVGVFIHGRGGTATLRDLRVARTIMSADSGAGFGLVAVESAEVDIERFRVEDNAVAGIQIATDARVRARDGVVSGSPVGVNVQTPGIDPADLSDGVIYIDNDQNLDSSELPVPAASGE